jgi:hypothetical protein
MMPMMILILAFAAAQHSLPLHAPRPGEKTRTPIGTRLPQPIPEDPLENQQRAVELLQQFAACVVDREPARTAAVVDAPPAPREALRRAALKRIESRMSDCLTRLNGAKMSLQAEPLVGMFANELYRRRWATRPPLGAGTMPDSLDDAAYRLTVSFVDCLIDGDPAAADAFARSTVRSPEEAAALAGLAPHYGGCLTAGSTLTLSRLALRSALALRLYRRAMAGTP